MKIALLQTDIVWNNPQANIVRVEKLMRQAVAADLYVLPEMWATGFATEPEGIAEDEQLSAALAWMKQTARQRGCALSGSLAVATPNDIPGGPPSNPSEGEEPSAERLRVYRNRHYFVTPEGMAFYDKHHLFTHGHEDEHFTAGQQPVIVEWQGWRILLLTCYDLRFPCFSRYGQAGFYDAIICVANWPEKRQLAWDTLVRARAIENQCYVIAVNRTGADPVCQYAGGSVVIDPVGRTVAGCPAGEHPATAEIFIEKLHDMRSHFRVLDDRD